MEKSELIFEDGKKYVKVPFYKEDGKNSYFSQFEENMLETGNIEGLSKITKRIMDGETYYLFSVSCYMSLKERFLRDSFTKEVFGELFLELLQVNEKMKTYLLDTGVICLDPEYIFYDEKRKRYVFLPTADNIQRITEKYEKLFGFFADICPTTEKDLLEFIFEAFGTLNQDTFDEISFIKSMVEFSYKEETETEVFQEYEKELIEEMYEKETVEGPKMRGVLLIGLSLLLLAFLLSYVCKYNFKNGIVAVAAVILAIGLMGFEVVKIVKSGFKVKDM